MLFDVHSPYHVNSFLLSHVHHIQTVIVIIGIRVAYAVMCQIEKGVVALDLNGRLLILVIELDQRG